MAWLYFIVVYGLPFIWSCVWFALYLVLCKVYVLSSVVYGLTCVWCRVWPALYLVFCMACLVFDVVYGLHYVWCCVWPALYLMLCMARLINGVSCGIFWRLFIGDILVFCMACLIFGHLTQCEIVWKVTRNSAGPCHRHTQHVDRGIKPEEPEEEKMVILAN